MILLLPAIASALMGFAVGHAKGDGRSPAFSDRILVNLS